MSVKSDVYYIPVDNATSRTERAERLRDVLEQAGFPQCDAVSPNACIKMHFGEVGNTGYVSPYLVAVIADAVKKSGGSAVCADTNTLYRGQRTCSADHMALAEKHGFSAATTGAAVEIPDEKIPDSVVSLPVHGRHLSTVTTFRLFTGTDLLVGLAHFKGHLMTGFGGALKNVGMGCATREGKLLQHCTGAPFVVSENCIGCGACCEVCPVEAITLQEAKVAVVDAARCIGCASCIAACGSDAVELEWGSGAGTIVEKMVEHAAGILAAVKKKVFINIATHITAECDCLAKDDPQIIADIGYLVSNDPVAVDQACYDLSCVQAGGFDPYRKAHPRRDPLAQLDYAEHLGVGSRAYNLIRLAIK